MLFRSGISSGEVAELLHLDKSTLTGVLQRLERRGLLRRARDKSDGRRIELRLTAGGRAMLGGQQHTVESVVRRALGSQTEKAVREATGVLRHLTEAIAKAPPPARAPRR